MIARRTVLRAMLILLLSQTSIALKAQLMNHYWSQSFNSISSLLSGAVVAGDAGQSAIYYNPATISELSFGTNFGFSASFLTLNYYTFKNALGPKNDLSASNFYIQPQFFSLSFNSPLKKLSFEIATFTRIRERISISYSNSEFETVHDNNNSFTQRHTSSFEFKNDYDDSWIGIGGAYMFSDKFSIGASLIASVSTLNYYYDLGALLHPLADTAVGSTEGVTFLVAENEYNELIKFTNVRLVAKAGLSYRTGRWSLGLNLTIPTFNVFSTGRQAERYQKELYVVSDTISSLSGYFIYDSQEGSDIKTNFKLPFSAALGVIYDQKERNRRYYVTIEFFAGIKPYKMVDAPINENITSKPVYDELENKAWLSYAYSSRPLLNIALGYQSKIRHKLLFMMGFRTDFNSSDNQDLKNLSAYNSMKTTNYNIYHFTSGLQFHFKKHLLVTGTQISYGYRGNQEQIANFNNVELGDTGRELPLFGVKENTLEAHYFAISLFLGATLNFDKSQKK